MNITDVHPKQKRLTDEEIGQLNDLIEINLDSEKGFRETANDLENSNYQSLFYEIAQERKDQAKELQIYISGLGGDASEKSGSLTAKAHRWWAELRDKVSNSPNYAMLAEAERGEDRILHLYQDVVCPVEDTPAYGLVTEHLNRVKARHDKIRDLRDMEKEREIN